MSYSGIDMASSYTYGAVRRRLDDSSSSSQGVGSFVSTTGAVFVPPPAPVPETTTTPPLLTNTTTPPALNFNTSNVIGYVTIGIIVVALVICCLRARKT